MCRRKVYKVLGIALLILLVGLPLGGYLIYRIGANVWLYREYQQNDLALWEHANRQDVAYSLAVTFAYPNNTRQAVEAYLAANALEAECVALNADQGYWWGHSIVCDVSGMPPNTLRRHYAVYRLYFDFGRQNPDRLHYVAARLMQDNGCLYCPHELRFEWADTYPVRVYGG